MRERLCTEREANLQWQLRGYDGEEGRGWCKETQQSRNDEHASKRSEGKLRQEHISEGGESVIVWK